MTPDYNDVNHSLQRMHQGDSPPETGDRGVSWSGVVVTVVALIVLVIAFGLAGTF